MTHRRTPSPFGRLTVECLEARDVPAGDGLTATYFDNINFTEPVVTRVDPTVNFRWGTGAPAPGMGPNTFSVRWTGQVLPGFSETYTFYVVSDDGARLWVDGKLVIDHWASHNATEVRGKITLQAGKPVDIRMDYYENLKKAVATLSWSSPSRAKQIVPVARLYSTAVPPAPAAPAAPSGLTATPASESSVRLAWADNATNETGYVVERSTNGTTFTPIATLGVNAQAYTDTGLSPLTTYHYRVRAVNEAGSSAAAAAAATTPARVVTVGTTAEFRAAVLAATPGTRIELLPGVYAGDNYFGNVWGEAGRPVVIAAADPANKPIFRGGSEALHFSDVAYLELRDLIVEGATGNGINIDDAGTYDTPAHHVVLSGLVVRDIGLTGNQDGIKLSGVQNFRVENSVIVRWGAGGSGIDMVGCHAGVIEGSYFAHGDRVGANGVQAKGGSTGIVIRGNRFEHAGSRAVQIGGSTGLEFFRPQPPAGYEASNVTVERNVIIGSEAAIAFVNTDGALVRYNTIYRPVRYVIRILQETTAPGFVPSRNGVFEDNIVAFRSDEIVGAVNIGPGTAPETFQFARNWWYNIASPSQSVPSLPTAEVGGTYGIDPQFVDPVNGDFHLRAGSPASGVGAYA